jgi:adenine-specific DNA glycosylase
LRWLSVVVEDATGDRVYVVAADRGRWWHGLRDFPREELTDQTAADRARAIAEKLGAVELTPLGLVKHTVTHHKIVVEPFRLRLPTEGNLPVSGLPAGEWLPRRDAENARLSGLGKKILQRAEALRR